MNISIETRKTILKGLFIISFFPLIFYTNSIPAENLEDPEDFSRLLGLMLGFTGALLIWWQFWLGFRGIVSKLIVDLLWVNNFHKKIGIYGTLLIFAHPILIVLSSVIVNGIGIVEYYLPNLGTEYQKHIFFGTLAFDILLVIWVASAILRAKIAFRPWRYIHYFTLILFPLVYLHASEIGSGILSNRNLASYFDLLFAIYIFGIVLRILYQTGFNKYEFVLTSINKLTENTNEYTFVPNNGKKIRSKPGQFFYIQPDTFAEDHPFSVSRYSEYDGSISFAIKTFGKFTQNLQHIEQGKKVYIDGPYGVFTQHIEKTDRPSIFIAGGIGITPYIQYATTKGLTKPELLIYGNRTTNDIAYKEEAENGFDKVVHVLSNEELVQEGYEKGYVSRELIEKYISKPIQSYDFYVCGPPIMMKMVEKFLKEADVDESQIDMEKFSL